MFQQFQIRNTIFSIVIVLAPVGALLGTTSTAHAQNTVTGITVTNLNDPDGSEICIGDTIRFRVNYNGTDMLTEVEWKWRSSECNPPRQWTTWIDGESIDRVADHIGTYEIIAKATFTDINMENLYNVESEPVEFEVLPPDTVELVNPASSPVLDVNVPTVPSLLTAA